MTEQVSPSAPTPKSTNRTLLIISQIISDALSPMFVPTIGMIIIMTLTVLRILPSSTRIGSTLGVFFITCVLPMLYIFILMKLGRVSNTSISNPKERVVPFLGTIICYIGAVFYIITLHAPMWMVLFFVGAVIITVIALLITFKWKISAHASAIGGLTGMIFWLAWNNMLPSGKFAILSVTIFILGCMCSARLILGHHTLGQVLCGSALGIGVELLLMFLFATPAISS